MMGKATASGTTANDSHSPAVIKKSKSKKHPNPAEDLSETTMPKDSASSVTESKDLGTTPASEATGFQPKKTSKKSKNLPKAPPEGAEILTVAAVSPKKSKKRKHRTEDHDSQKDDVAISTKDTVEEPPKKKHKNRTEFADPRVDSTLNAQSRKALEYAFMQMNRPSKWKFNKARQNWLIRNIWNPEAISDIYFPFVLKYLINVQGGSREKLKESCQTYLKLPEVAETPAQADEAVPLTPKSILKTPSLPMKPTPGPLIDTPPTPGALIAPDSAFPPAATTSSPAEPLAAIRRKRAQTLYDALCSDASASMET